MVKSFTKPIKQLKVGAAVVPANLAELTGKNAAKMILKLYGEQSMKPIHIQETKQFKKLFKQEGIDRIEERFAILDAFLQTEQHVTVDELTSLLEKQQTILAKDFVKDTLKLLVRFGFAEENRFDNGKNRYEHRHLGQHHDHMVCTKCRKIIEFTDDHLEMLQLQIAGEFGFHMLLHKMEIYGICSDCLKKHPKLMPLHKAKPGERLVIKKYASGATNENMRLLNIGLRVGDEVEVISNLGMGQVVVASKDNRYVLGKEMSEEIMVEHVKKELR